MRRIKNTKAKIIHKIYVNKSSTMYFPRFCYIGKVILYNKKDLRDRISSSTFDEKLIIGESPP